MPNPITWEEWRKKAAASYKKGTYTARDMVNDWGYPSDIDQETFRIIFRSGSPGLKSREAINNGKRVSNGSRNRRNGYSTDQAQSQAKQQAAEYQRIIDEAQMFELDGEEFNYMVEHGLSVLQHDQHSDGGAPNDPDNKYLNTVVDGIHKTDAENYLKTQGLDSQFVIGQDEQNGRLRVIPSWEYNQLGFMSEQGAPFNDLVELKANLEEPRAIGRRAPGRFMGKLTSGSSGAISLELIERAAEMQAGPGGAEALKEVSNGTYHKNGHMADIARKNGGVNGMPDFGLTEQIFGKSLVQDERNGL